MIYAQYGSIISWAYHDSWTIEDDAVKLWYLRHFASAVRYVGAEPMAPEEAVTDSEIPKLPRASRLDGALRYLVSRMVREADETARRAHALGHPVHRDGTLLPPPDAHRVRAWLCYLLHHEEQRTLDKLDRVSWEVARLYARRWHERLAKPVGEPAGAEGTGCPIVFSDGSCWVKLLTPEALDREGEAMGSCVGKTMYQDYVGPRVQAGDGVWSLRDQAGRSVMTIEAKDGYPHQVKGPGNAAHMMEHVDRLPPLLKVIAAETGGPMLTPGWVLMDARTGSWVHEDALPVGMTIHTNAKHVVLRPWQVPRGLHVIGDLTVVCEEDREFEIPAGLRVEGYLCVTGRGGRRARLRSDAHVGKGLIVAGPGPLRKAPAGVAGVIRSVDPEQALREINCPPQGADMPVTAAGWVHRLLADARVPS